MHGDRNNFYLIAFIFFEYQQKVRKIKYNQPDFFIKDYDQFLSFPAGKVLANCFHAIWSKRKTLYKTEPLAFSFESLHSLARLW